MAKGGSGDVLSGIIGAFIAQVKEPKVLNASKAAVYLHGLSGDISAKENTQIGMKPTDIALNMYKALKKIGLK